MAWLARLAQQWCQYKYYVLVGTLPTWLDGTQSTSPRQNHEQTAAALFSLHVAPVSPGRSYGRNGIVNAAKQTPVGHFHSSHLQAAITYITQDISTTYAIHAYAQCGGSKWNYHDETKTPRGLVDRVNKQEKRHGHLTGLVITKSCGTRPSLQRRTDPDPDPHGAAFSSTPAKPI